MEASVLSPIDEFSDILDLLLDDISHIVYELNLDNLCIDINTAAVDLMRSIVWKHDMTQVMESIVVDEDTWERIRKRDVTLVTTDLCSALKKNAVPIDTDVLCVAFIYYEKICSSSKWRRVPDDDRPVSKSDMNTLWDHIYNLIDCVERKSGV